ncbi:ceramide kinase [Brevipalpus obovatus]|uniref:ceramide kinase n=1 Tax=Brevipalpus obovatus TaxID=246614 RepID=UPI003D9EB8F4
MKEDKSFIIVGKFMISGKRSRVLVNRNCIICESEDQPSQRTIVPLNLVVALKTCFCSKIKKSTCDCLKKEENQNFYSSSGDLTPGTDTSANRDSATNTGNKNIDSDQNQNVSPVVKLKHIRIYYAVPSGQFSYKLTHLIVDPVEQSDAELRNWIESVNNLLQEFERPKRLMVFVNPYGGKRRGPKIYSHKVLPLFKIAGCTVDCIITQRANHARDVIMDSTFPVTSYDGLICVGGDGMFSELLNGLLLRTQEEANVNYHSTQSELKRPVTPIGVIPAGSTDAVCFGVCGNNDPVTAALHVILGNQINIDVSAVHSSRDEEQLIRYATTLLGYGFLGDTMLASEKSRWMGPKRYDWAGFKKVLGHKVYQGEIKLHVSTEDGSPKDRDICASNCPLCAKSAFRAKYENDPDKREINDGVVCMAIRGGFIAVNAVTMSCRCEKAKRGLSPAAHLGNGCADLILVSKCSRANYLRFLMRIASNGKSPFDLDFVDVYRVKEFEFNPIVSPEGSSKKYKVSDASVWNCDGEVISEPALHVKVHCQLVPLFGNGGENRDLGKNGSFFLSSKNKVHSISPEKNIINGQTADISVNAIEQTS